MKETNTHYYTDLYYYRLYILSMILLSSVNLAEGFNSNMSTPLIIHQHGEKEKY